MKEKITQKIKQNPENLIIIVLVFATILSAVISNKLFHQKADTLIKPYAMTILMIVIVWFGIEVDKFQVIKEKRQQYLFELAYLAALFIILLSEKYPIYNLWMIGGVAISAYISVYLGLSVQFIFTYLICSLKNYDIEKFLFFFIIGAVICLLSQYANKMTTFVYTAIISASCHVILLFLMNNFIFHESLNINGLLSVITTILILCVVYIGFKYGRKWMFWLLDSPDSAIKKNKSLKQKVALEKIEQDYVEDTIQETEDTQPFFIDDYDRILADDFILIIELRKKSEFLYRHSLKVAEMAANAAVVLDCDEKLAKAGGLYHEIGKLRSKDYIESGILIAKEYHFPKEVIDIIRQHNSKLEKPKSKEAVIVMLAESVVSTINYFEHEKKKALKEGRTIKDQPLNKIVENIFDIRFEKGTLDESGISILEYKKLKNLYMGYYS